MKIFPKENFPQNLPTLFQKKRRLQQNIPIFNFSCFGKIMHPNKQWCKSGTFVFI
jgi:hypothetical protein